jgi:hypothetical protein
MRERKARKARKSKSIVLNDTPKCRSWRKTIESGKWEIKKQEIRWQNENRQFRIQLQRSDILIAGVGCPEWFCCSAVRTGRLSRMRLLAVQNVQNGKVRMKTGNSEFSSRGATY